jgi:hypothetical protein
VPAVLSPFHSHQDTGSHRTDIWFL